MLRGAPLEMLFASDFRLLDPLEAMDIAVFGREVTALGGCGKAPMLIVFLTLFCGSAERFLFRADPVLIVRTSGVEVVCGLVGRADGRGVVGSLDMGGGRGASLEVWVCDATGKLFRGGLIDFWGIGGRAEVGGSAVGRESTGRVVAMEVDMTALTANVQPVPVRMRLPSTEKCERAPSTENSGVKSVVLQVNCRFPAYMCWLTQVKSWSICS